MRHTRTRELPGNDASRAFPLQSYQVPRTNHFWLNERAAHISPFPSGVLCASQQKNSLIMNLIPWTWADFRYFSCRFHRVFHHINTGAGKKTHENSYNKVHLFTFTDSELNVYDVRFWTMCQIPNNRHQNTTTQTSFILIKLCCFCTNEQ